MDFLFIVHDQGLAVPARFENLHSPLHGHSECQVHHDFQILDPAASHMRPESSEIAAVNGLESLLDTGLGQMGLDLEVDHRIESAAGACRHCWGVGAASVAINVDE